MVLGVGTDILRIKELAKANLLIGDPFLTATYDQKEIEQAQLVDDPYSYFATRFAGKEAVFKCLGIEPIRICLKEICILNKACGQPYVILSGELLKKTKEMGICKIDISLSYDKEYVIAYALAQNGA